MLKRLNAFFVMLVCSLAGLAAWYGIALLLFNLGR